MAFLEELQMEGVASHFARIPMFPFFDLTHYMLSLMYLRHEEGICNVSRKSPITCWICSMLSCFGGAMLAAFMLGEPVIKPFESNINIVLATIVWYMVFYFPKDLFFKFCSLLPAKLIIVAGKEIARVRKIAVGVAHAHHVYHHGYIVMVAVGLAKGAGSGLIATIEQLLRGVWKPETNELLDMPFATKATLLGAVLFTMQKTGYVPISKELLILIITTLLVTIKVTLTIMHSHGSPLAPVESALCRVLFGSLPESSSHDEHKTGHGSGARAPEPGKQTRDDNEASLRKRKTKKAE
uniref:Transmembrane protein 38A n=2 Tax=Eptatretus burgeri TaxID=7764 RepID=A0A8C4RD52_EPTBU